jgi:hypothetical protein
MYLCMYVFIYVCMYLLCMYVSMYVFMYVFIYLCMYVFIMYVCKYVRIYVCMYVCMYNLTPFWILTTMFHFAVEAETHYCDSKSNVSREVWRFLRDGNFEFQVSAETVISYIQWVN